MPGLCVGRVEVVIIVEGPVTAARLEVGGELRLIRDVVLDEDEVVLPAPQRAEQAPVVPVAPLDVDPLGVLGRSAHRLRVPLRHHLPTAVVVRHVGHDDPRLGLDGRGEVEQRLLWHLAEDLVHHAAGVDDALHPLAGADHLQLDRLHRERSHSIAHVVARPRGAGHDHFFTCGRWRFRVSRSSDSNERPNLASMG